MAPVVVVVVVVVVVAASGHMKKHGADVDGSLIPLNV